MFFLAVCLVKTLQIPVSVFGWFALGGESNKSEENTGMHDTFQAPCRKKLAKTVFSTHSLKKTVNRGVLDESCP